MVKLSALAGGAMVIPATAMMPASTAAAPKRAESEITFVTVVPQLLRPKWMVKSATHVGKTISTVDVIGSTFLTLLIQFSRGKGVRDWGQGPPAIAPVRMPFELCFQSKFRGLRWS